MDGNLVADTTQWVAGKDYPEWMDEVGVATISKGYLLPDETPKKHIEESHMQSQPGLIDRIWKISSTDTFGTVGLALLLPCCLTLGPIGVFPSAVLVLIHLTALGELD